MLFLRVFVSDAIGDEVGGALQVLLANVAMLLLAGTLTLAVQRRFGRGPTALTAVSRAGPER